MSAISYHEYHSEVRGLAQELVKRELEDGCDIYDMLHETADGHEWTTFTSYGIAVLERSPNDNAYFEDFGGLTANSFSEVVAKLAYAAFSRDIAEALDSQRDNARRSYTVTLTDVCYVDHSGLDLPESYTLTVDADSEQDAVASVVDALETSAGKPLDNYSHDATLTVTFDE